MGDIFSPSIPSPQKDPALAAREAEAKKKAEDERLAEETRTAEEGAATAKGLRGYRSLLSGSFAGYNPGSGRGLVSR